MTDNNAIDVSPAMKLKSFFEEQLPAFQKIVPKHIEPQKFITVLLNSAWKNEIIMRCDPYSLLRAALDLAELGLMPGGYTGQACIIPYYNKKKGRYEAQAQIMYQGIIDLVSRSGEVADIRARMVYENDQFEYEYGLDDKLIHKPYLGEDKGEIKYVYAYIKYKDGFRAFEVMSINQINKIRDNTQAYRKGYDTPWKSDVGYPAMCKKTVIKKLLKTVPKMVENVRKAINQDDEVEFGAIRQGISGQVESKTEKAIEAAAEEAKDNKKE